MAKYDAIRDWLQARSDIVDIGFEELSNKIPGGLPYSAYHWGEWWNNDDPTHPQSKAWAAAGYTARANLGRRTVTFTPAWPAGRRTELM